MAFVGIMCTEAEILQKMGANTSTAEPFTTTAMTDACAMAESFVNVATRYNWSDWYAGSSTSPDTTGIFNDTVSSLVAIQGIAHDMSAGNRIEMEDRINVLRDGVLRNISILRDDKTARFIRGETI